MDRASAESLAALCAEIDDPFADRNAVLRNAGLDEARLARALDELTTTLRGDPEATPLFSAAYERQRSVVRKRRAREAQEPIPAARPQAFRQPEHDIDGTAAGIPVFMPALPFDQGAETVPPSASPLADEGSPAPAAADIDATAEVSALPDDAWPFDSGVANKPRSG